MESSRKKNGERRKKYESSTASLFHSSFRIFVYLARQFVNYAQSARQCAKMAIIPISNWETLCKRSNIGAIQWHCSRITGQLSLHHSWFVSLRWESFRLFGCFATILCSIPTDASETIDEYFTSFPRLRRASDLKRIDWETNQRRNSFRQR